METFGQRITKLRMQRNLTQREVAEALRIPLSTYKEWEYGRRIQGEGKYVGLSEVFEVSLRTLLTGEPQADKNELLEKVRHASILINEVKKALNSFF